MKIENQDLGTITVEEAGMSNADIMAQMMAEYEPTPVPAVEEVIAPETDELEEVTEEDGTETVEETTEQPTEAVVEPETTTTTAPTTEETQTSKSDAAFKRMRQEAEAYKAQAEQNANYANVIKEIAQANGVTPDELIKSYNDRKAAQEAEKQGIPVAEDPTSNKTMSIIMPALMGIFPLFYNAAFGIYLVASGLVTIITSTVTTLIVDNIDAISFKRNKEKNRASYSRKK